MGGKGSAFGGSAQRKDEEVIVGLRGSCSSSSVLSNGEFRLCRSSLTQNISKTSERVVLADVCSLRGRILSDFGDIVTFL